MTQKFNLYQDLTYSAVHKLMGDFCLPKAAKDTETDPTATHIVSYYWKMFSKELCERDMKYRDICSLVENVYYSVASHFGAVPQDIPRNAQIVVAMIDAYKFDFLMSLYDRLQFKTDEKEVSDSLHGVLGVFLEKLEDQTDSLLALTTIAVKTTFNVPAEYL